jgi:hypothetical protein
MTWSDVKKTLTTPPPPRPPPPKHPVFTKDFFSTKSFGPGHLVGAVVLFGGLFGITKIIIDRSRAQADESRRLAQRPVPAGPPPGPSPGPPREEPSLAKVENQRGEYGKR